MGYMTLHKDSAASLLELVEYHPTVIPKLNCKDLVCNENSYTKLNSKGPLTMRQFRVVQTYFRELSISELNIFIAVTARFKFYHKILIYIYLDSL